jgi:PTS system nitrogen regulatory IIA component
MESLGGRRVVGIFARSLDSRFASLDGGPTHLFCVLIAPENAAADHLKALARISRLLKDPTFRSRLIAGKTGQEIFEIIAQEDQKF